MSQKKVDAYKQKKANRAQIMKKEKRMLLLEKIGAALVCLAAVAWVGFSMYGKVESTKTVEKQETVINTSALDEYITGLSAEEMEE